MGKNRSNKEWLNDLSAEGPVQTEAIEDLRRILFWAAQKTFCRCLGDLQAYPPDTIIALSEDSAQEALISVLAHLHEFRGESKFTTWAFKFAVHIALTSARRERQKLILPEFKRKSQGPDGWLFMREDQTSPDPELPALKEEIWEAILSVIRNDLTLRQQEVLRLLVFDEVPTDEVVEHLGTNRNAIYKVLHDARQKIKVELLGRGIGLEYVLSLFGEEELY